MVHYFIVRLNEFDRPLSSLFRQQILKKWPIGETLYLKPIFCEWYFGKVTLLEFKSLRLWEYPVCHPDGTRWFLTWVSSLRNCTLQSSAQCCCLLCAACPCLPAWGSDRIASVSEGSLHRKWSTTCRVAGWWAALKWTFRPSLPCNRCDVVRQPET